MKVVPEVVMASMSLTCDVTIISATAEVNPEETGPETKSIRNPEILSRLLRKPSC